MTIANYRVIFDIMMSDEDITQPHKLSFKSIGSVLSYWAKANVSDIASSFLHTLDWHHPPVGSCCIVDRNFVADKDS